MLWNLGMRGRGGIAVEVVPQDDKVDVLGCMIGFLDAWDDALSYSGLTFMDFTRQGQDGSQ